ncbi:hypothetical protein LPJ56_000164 [Coemansia sp. RSA 2599]|nr:hypothetical protein LPJ75_000028 [Coemansia sp. RSA 2598]KAJ1829645.1 hypothetical protein LPJ56_000164 [Coemansia sp. RSA 2599]
MDTLIRDCEKLAKHQNSSSTKTLASIDQAIKALQTARNSIDASSNSNSGTGMPNTEGLVNAKQQVEKAQQVSDEHIRELYTNVSKYGKHVEKAFKLDLSVVGESKAFEDKKEELGYAILQHFLREGDFVLAAEFANESRLDLPRETRMRFEQMYGIVSLMRSEGHELGAAIAWAVERREELEIQGSGLEFTLHRLRFLQLVEGGMGTDALVYAREWFPRYSKDPARMDEIEHLMGIFIYAKRLQTSPYAYLFTEHRWEQGARMFAAAFCASMGLASTSPLSVTVDAGASALPVVCKVSGLMRERKVEWSQQNELAVEVPLPDSMRFHSVFACPVSKEQATPDNPPMAMPCGHVVCKASLEKLARGVRPGTVASGRFKCPYCPVMSSLADAKKVYF